MIDRNKVYQIASDNPNGLADMLLIFSEASGWHTKDSNNRVVLSEHSDKYIELWLVAKYIHEYIDDRSNTIDFENKNIIYI